MAEESEKKEGSLLERLVPILLVGSIVLAFFVGILWQRVSNIEKDGGDSVAGVEDQIAGEEVGQVQPPTQGKMPEDQAKKIVPVSDSDHVRGGREAQVYLIEYSDYECPFCSRFHATAKQVLDEYSSKVSWVYRHFPLDQLHANARPAAEASECVASLAGEEAFWEFSDALYGDASKVSDLTSVAVSVGVDKNQFENCLDSGDFKDKVEGQYQSGVGAGVTGTPGNFLVNSKGEAWFIPGAVPFEQIKTTIDEALSS